MIPGITLTLLSQDSSTSLGGCCLKIYCTRLQSYIADDSSVDVSKMQTVNRGG